MYQGDTRARSIAKLHGCDAPLPFTNGGCWAGWASGWASGLASGLAQRSTPRGRTRTVGRWGVWWRRTAHACSECAVCESSTASKGAIHLSASVESRSTACALRIERCALRTRCLLVGLRAYRDEKKSHAGASLSCVVPSSPARTRGKAAHVGPACTRRRGCESPRSAPGREPLVDIVRTKMR